MLSNPSPVPFKSRPLRICPGSIAGIDVPMSNAYSRKVFRWLGRAVTIFALCCAIGLHWLTLQSIAWTSMIIDYSKQDSICHAIAKTLDGAHPCSLCHVVNAGKNSEKKSDLQSPTRKIDMICGLRTTSLLHPFVPFEYAARDFSFEELRRSPPAPPPRFLVG